MQPHFFLPISIRPKLLCVSKPSGSPFMALALEGLQDQLKGAGLEATEGAEVRGLVEGKGRCRRRSKSKPLWRSGFQQWLQHSLSWEVIAATNRHVESRHLCSQGPGPRALWPARINPMPSSRIPLVTNKAVELDQDGIDSGGLSAGTKATSGCRARPSF